MGIGAFKELEEKEAPMRRLAVVALLIGSSIAGGLVAPAQAGGGGGCYEPASDGSGVNVSINRMCFAPTVIHIEPGDTVTWTNREGLLHAVAGMGRPWNQTPSMRDLGNGDSVSFSFQTNGVYPYYCPYHLGMIGAVVVGDGSGPGAAKPGNQDLAVAPPPEAPASEDVSLDDAATSAPESTSNNLVPLLLLVLLGGVTTGALAGRKLTARPPASGTGERTA